MTYAAHFTAIPQIVLGEEKTIAGGHASWSCPLPLEEPSAESPVVDAVPFKADATLQNEASIKGNIMLCIRGGGTSFVDKAKRASAAGAAAVIIINTDDKLMPITDGTQSCSEQSEDGYKSDIPVLMIKSSDAPRLQERGRARLWKRGGRKPLTVEPCPK